MAFCLALSGLYVTCSAPVLAYQVVCDGQSIVVTTMTSVMGEARGSAGNPTVPSHFHGGIDISDSQCRTAKAVWNINSGTGTKIDCPGDDCALRVEDSPLHYIDYIHLLDSTVPTGYIQKNSTVGLINSQNHLHLQEGGNILSEGSRAWYRIQPPRLNGVIFDRGQPPTFVSTTVAGTSGSLILIQEYEGPGADGTNSSSATVFQVRQSSYFVTGRVDILVTANGYPGPGMPGRKGLYFVGWSKTHDGITSSLVTQAYNTLRVSPADQPKDLRTLYFWTTPGKSNTFIATNLKVNYKPSDESRDETWDTMLESEGDYSICAIIQDYPYPNGRQIAPQCVPVVVDRHAPQVGFKNGSGEGFTRATSSTYVVVTSTDSGSGVWRVLMTRPDGTVTYSTAPTDQAYQTWDAAFASLATGSYSAAVHDLAGNVSSWDFKIDTDPADDLAAVPGGGGSFSGGWITNDKCAVFRARDTGSGVKSMCVSCSPQECAEYSVGPSTALFAGAFCNLGLGTCTQTITDLAGNTTNYYRTVSSTTIQFVHSVSSPGWSSGDVPVTVTTMAVASQALSVHAVIVGLGAGTCNASTQDAWCDKIRTTGDGAVWPCACSADGASVASSMTFSAPATSVSYHAENAGSTSGGDHLRFTTGGLGVAQIEYNNYGWEPGHYVDGVVTVPEVAGTTWTSVSSDPLYVYGPLGNIDIQDSAALTAPQEGARLTQVLRLSSPRVYTLDPDGQTVVTTTFTVKFQYLDSVGTDTDTLRVYWFDGSSWSTDLFSGLSVTKDTSDFITAIVQSTFTGVYAAFFDGVDSSAPVTSWTVEGSSSGFQGSVILSTYSYFVLSSTDPSIGGYASGVATTYYRIDGLPGDAYSVYSSSLSFLPGTHWVDAYSIDWAGNSESVSRATITVTAGSVTKLSSDLQVDGNLLVGFLGSGAKAEVVARSEYDYALMVSSIDGRALLAVDNANFASIGTAPASGRLTLQGVAGDTALALRSGNSTAAVTGAQLAFGYDGTGELRHALLTQHGSAAYDNRLEFALWSPDVSSSSLAGTRVLSLQGSTITSAGALVEVRPADIPGDPANVELEVSDGATTGGGYVLRAEAVSPSSRALKKDIRYLTLKDEEQAYEDVAALRPAVFQRKRYGKDGVARSDPAAPQERGLIYEETPKSIRGRPGEIIYDERLVNAELALKAAMRRIEELSASLKRLKEQGK